MAKLKPEEEYSLSELYRPDKSPTAGRDFIPFLIKVDFFSFLFFWNPFRNDLRENDVSGSSSQGQKFFLLTTRPQDHI